MRLVLGILFALAASGDDRIGRIEFFGGKGLDVEAVRAKMPFREGDGWQQALDRNKVEAAIGMKPTDVATVCCDGQGQWMIWVGLPGGSQKTVAYAARPAGQITAPELRREYDGLMQVLGKAVRSGTAGAEDHSQGYALASAPKLRAAQMAFRAYALSHEEEIYAALAGSREDEARAAAAAAAGYARQSERQIAALVRAARDPDDTVRNNATRALGVLANSSPEVARRIPAGPSVEMLSSRIWSDRNKSVMLLMSLPAAALEFPAETLEALREMSEWHNASYAGGPRQLLERAEAVQLSLDAAKWRKRTWETEGATLEVTAEGLRVGPVLGGIGSARLEYSEPVPVTAGVIHGRYKTEGMLPRQVVVRVGSRSVALPASKEWGRFEVPITRLPPGSGNVTVAFGLGEKTEGRVQFTDLYITRGYAAPALADKPVLTRPGVPKLPAGARVRVEKRGDTWWMVKPDGEAFYSIGTLPAYAQPDAAATAAIKGLGFNSLAGSHDVRRWAELQTGLMQFRTLETRVGAGYDTLVNAMGENPGSSQAKAAAAGGFNHAFPDPWDARWRTALRARVREVAAVVKNDLQFAAWFADNEREHKDLHRYVWSAGCAAQFGRFLEKKYGAIAGLNAAWGQRYGSFAELLSSRPDPVMRDGAMYEDFRLFSREILREFNRIVLATIREEDPGRLVFSNRFMIGESRDVLENLDLYREFDGIAVNIYPSNLAAGLDAAERQYLEEVYARTGKPVLIAEWSVPALDSGLYGNPAKLDWSYPQALETQRQRALQAAQVEADLYNLPFVVGAHWFAWKDFDSPARQANRGLFKANGEAWVELQDALRALHGRMR